MEKFKYKKSLGQNFLQDKEIIDKIVSSAQIDDETLLIEIGPGAGAITAKIVPLCKNAILYEMDERLEKNLYNLLKNNNNFEIKIGDFLETNLQDDIKKYNYKKLYVVANLPYYITTPIIMKFLDSNVIPDKLVIMVQNEVADRFSALPNSKNYGSLTVLLNYYYKVSKLFVVNRNCFIPIPNVDSAVVCFERKNDILSVSDIKGFKNLLKNAFKYKRKNLKNNLKEYDLNMINDILYKYGYNLNCRAENLPLEVFIDISNNIV